MRARRGPIANGCAICWRGRRVPHFSACVLLVGDLDRTQALVNTAGLWTFVLAIDFVVSFSYTLLPRRPKGEAQEHPVTS